MLHLTVDGNPRVQNLYFYVCWINPKSNVSRKRNNGKHSWAQYLGVMIEYLLQLIFATFENPQLIFGKLVFMILWFILDTEIKWVRKILHL